MEKYLQALSLFVPDGILEYFEVKKVRMSVREKEIKIWIEEKVDPSWRDPSCYSFVRYAASFKMKTFKLRNYVVLFFVKKAWWLNRLTQEEEQSPIDMLYKQSTLEKDYACYLRKTYTNL